MIFQIQVIRINCLPVPVTKKTSYGKFQLAKAHYSKMMYQIIAQHHSQRPFFHPMIDPHSGSPWTIEFLNRIREKSKLRQQNLHSDTSASPYEISGNIAKVPTRRSPSILEFFKYQGGSTPRKILEQRKQKRNLQSSISSKNEKTSSFLLQTGTPIDKRARQVCINYHVSCLT